MLTSNEGGYTAGDLERALDRFFANNPDCKCFGCVEKTGSCVFKIKEKEPKSC